MKRNLCLVILFQLGITVCGLGQTITNYIFTSPAGTFTAITGSVPSISGTADEGYGNAIPIGFDFWYMGTRYTTVSGSSNGWLTLGANITNATPVNSLSSGGAPRPILAPLWDDLDVQNVNNITYLTTGVVGSRKFTLQYLDVKWGRTATGNTISFQVNLYEATGKIEYIYRQEGTAVTAPSASIGLGAILTGPGNFLSANNTGSGASSISEYNVTSKPATGKTYTFTPPVAAAPGSLTFPVVATTSMTLNWIDLSSNERGFVLYRSTDGVNYSFDSQTAANATSSSQTGLTAGTVYYFRVYAVTEGALSTSLSGSQSTVCLGSPVVSTSVTETCVGGSTGTVTANATGGTTPYTYSLNGGAYQASATFTGLAAGNNNISVLGAVGCASTVSVTIFPYANSADNQNDAAANSWIGHTYDATNFLNYIGRFTESENFNEFFGGNTTCFNITSNSIARSIYTETFSVKFRMVSSKKGLYVVDLGSDDGSRLTIDAVVPYNNFGFQSFTVKPSVLISLNGASSLLFEYFESSGGNQVMFQNLTLVLSNALSSNAVQSICIGSTGSAISGDTYATLPSGITLSGTGYQWSYSTTPAGARTNISGATGATFTPATTVAPFSTIGTYYVFRNATLSSVNNISPIPYVASNESNAATIVVSGPGQWTGNVSTDWADAGNWCTGVVPTALTDAFIPSGAVRMPSITSSVACKNLTISTGATLTIGGAGTLNIAGTLTNSGTILNTGTINFNGTTGQQTFSGVSTFHNLTLNNASGLLLPTGITVNNNLIIAVGTLNANNFTIAVKGNWTNNSSTTGFNPGNSTVTFNGTTGQTIGGSFVTTFNNLVGANTGGPVTLTSSESISGNLTVSAGTLDLSLFTANRITLGGILTVSNNATLRIGGTGTYPTNYATNTLLVASTVEYAGTNQTISNQLYGNLLLSSSGIAVKTFPATALTIVGNLSSTLGAGTSLSFTAAANMAVGGNVSIGASTTFNGASYSHIIGANWINNGTFNGNTSTLTFTGPGSAIGGSGVQNFNSVTIAASSIAFPNTSIALTGNLTTTGPGSISQASGGTLTMTGAGTTISGSGISLENVVISGSVTTAASVVINSDFSVSGSFVAIGGSISMTGTSKTIAGVGTKSFATLAIEGSVSTTSDFSISSGLSVNGTLIASAGTATFTATSTLSGSPNLYNVIINGTSLQLSANSTLGIANVLTVTAGSLDVTSTTPNTVDFNGLAQNITGVVYDNLILSNGNIKTATAGITMNNSLTIMAGTTFIPGAFTHSIYRNWNNYGTFTAGTSTIQFLGTQTIDINGPTTFNILTINNTDATTSINLFSNVSASTVNMTVGTLNTGSNTLTITSTRTGPGIILGNIQRTHVFTTGVAYAFEGPDNTITFSAVSGVGTIIVSVVHGSISDFTFGSSVTRLYTNTILAGTYTATLRLHYEDNELNGNNETAMGLWNYNGSIWIPFGKTANSTAANYVEQSGLTNINNRWTFATTPNAAQWNGSVSTDWNNALNWNVVLGSATTPPSSADVAVIGTSGFTFQPTISTPISVKNVVFGTAQAVTLSLATGGSLTSGDLLAIWSSDATHTINANNQTININGDLSLSDGVSGHAINLAIGSGTVNVTGSITQSGGSDIIFSGAGNLNIGGNLNYVNGTFTPSTGTVTYNGITNQAIGAVNYYNLAVNKSAAEASVSNSTTIAGNLTVTGTLDNLSNLTVMGNVSIAPTGILDNLATLHVGGNWLNNGAFNASGTGLFFDGAGTQTISSSTFNNLTINKPVGSIAELTGNISIKGDLTVTSGTFNIKTFDSNRSSSGGTLTLGAQATFIVGANNSPLNFSDGTLDNASTVIADGVGPQFIFGVDFGHLIFRNGGLKTLVAPIAVHGNLTIESGASFNGGSETLTLNGNWINNGTFTPSNSTIVLGGVAKTLGGNTTFNRITVPGSYTFLNDMTFNGLLNILSTGSLTAGSTILTTMNGDLRNSGVLNTVGTTTFTGNVLQTLSLINAVQTVAITVNFNGSVSPVLNSTSPPQYGFLNINNTGGVNPSVGWTVGLGFTVGSGASFNGGSVSHVLVGSVTNNGTITSNGSLTFISSAPATVNLGTNFTSTGNVVFAGAAAMTLAGSPMSFNNITISNSNIAGITPSSDWNIANDLTINSGSILNAGAHTHLIGDDLLINGTMLVNSLPMSVGGDWINNGTFTGPLSTVQFNGASIQPIMGSSVTDFNNVTISNLSNPGVRVESNQNLAGILTLTANVVFDADGSFNTSIFKMISSNDNPTQDASVAILPSGAQVIGNLTVQRFMTVEGPDNKRIYRYISSPIQNATVADIQNEIPVTGPFTGSSVCSGCLSNASMFFYQESVVTDTNGSGSNDFNDGYIRFPIAASSETLMPGTGYAMYVRGDLIPSALLDVRGIINNGNTTPVSLPVTFTSSGDIANDGWNLVGNPFPSTIDWESSTGWTKTNMESSIYVTDNGTGPLQYATWNGTTGTNGGSRNIAIGQGFWTKANGSGTPVLEVTENIKASGTQAIFFRKGSLADLLRIKMTQGTVRDEAVIHFREDATPGFDNHADARKLKNSTFNLSSLSEINESLAINSWSQLKCTSSIRLNVEGAASGQYSLVFSNLDSFDGAKFSLRDQFLDRSFSIANNQELMFEVTSDPTSKGKERFVITIERITAPLNIETADGILSVRYKTNVQWYLNDVIMLGETSSHITPTTSGLYSVMVKDGGCELRGSIQFLITGLEDSFPRGIKVFPIPVSDDLFITSEKWIESVVLINVTGVTLAEILLTGTVGFQKGTIDLSKNAPGIYLLKFATQTGVYTKKIIKK